MRRMQMTRAFYTPKGAIKIKPKDVDVEIYIYERAGKLYAAMFGGKRAKPDSHYRYRSAELRETAVKEYINSQARSEVAKAARQLARRCFRHSFKVGDILHGSWGYDQTQCEYYQVVAVDEFTATIREIAGRSVEGSGGNMSEQVLPVPDSFIGEPIVKRPQGSSGEEGYIAMRHFHLCVTDPNKSHYSSWYA